MEALIDAIKTNPLAAVLVVAMGGNTTWEFFEDSGTSKVETAQIQLLIYRVEQLEEELEKLEGE